jgi:hypothetical protein
MSYKTYTSHRRFPTRGSGRPGEIVAPGDRSRSAARWPVAGRLYAGPENNDY